MGILSHGENAGRPGTTGADGEEPAPLRTVAVHARTRRTRRRIGPAGTAAAATPGILAAGTGRRSRRGYGTRTLSACQSCVLARLELEDRRERVPVRASP